MSPSMSPCIARNQYFLEILNFCPHFKESLYFWMTEQSIPINDWWLFWENIYYYSNPFYLGHFLTQTVPVGLCQLQTFLFSPLGAVNSEIYKYIIYHSHYLDWRIIHGVISLLSMQTFFAQYLWLEMKVKWCEAIISNHKKVWKLSQLNHSWQMNGWFCIMYERLFL